MSFTGSTMGKYSRLWLIITGVILLAVGMAMAVGLGGIPFAGGAMLGTGGILATVGIAADRHRLHRRPSRGAGRPAARDGHPGHAQITGLTQTGMYLNEQPQVSMNLLVTVPGRPPYAATHKSFVPAHPARPVDLRRAAIGEGRSGRSAEDRGRLAERRPVRWPAGRYAADGRHAGHGSADASRRASHAGQPRQRPAAQAWTRASARYRPRWPQAVLPPRPRSRQRTRATTPSSSSAHTCALTDSRARHESTG